MALPDVRMGSNILQNPFANARSNGPQFNDPGKRSPASGNGQDPNPRSPTNTNNNDGFIPPTNDPANPNPQKTGDSDDPMLQFDKLWEDAPVDPKAPVPKEFKGYLPEIDPKAFSDRVDQMDFSNAVDPEITAAILKGGQDAADAYPKLMNSLGRAIFKQTFNASSKMTDAVSRNVEKRFMDDLIPNSIQNRIIDDTLVNDNKLAGDPKYAPLFASVKAQMTKKFPKATPQQVSTATKAYMDDYIANATKKDNVVDDNTKLLQKGSGDADWGAWLDNQAQTT